MDIDNRYECCDCRYFRINEENGVWYCKKTYTEACPNSYACDDFDLDD